MIAPAPIPDVSWLTTFTGTTAAPVAWAAAKLAMGMLVCGFSREFRDVTVNSLWPHFVIATSAARRELAESSLRCCMTPAVMANATLGLLTDITGDSGKFFKDIDVLRSMGVTDISPYHVNPDIPSSELLIDNMVVRDELKLMEYLDV